MMFLFWFSILLISYTYIGYPMQVWLLAKLRPRPILKGDPLNVDTAVSIVISARNEQQNIRQRIENLLAQDYPKDLLEIIIVSDGSTDCTATIVQQLIDEHPVLTIKLLVLEQNMGKPTALNTGVAAASSEFIIFTDCRQTFEPDVIRQLLTNFNDPDVGCVSGELKFWQDSGSHIQAEMGAYWSYEKFIRKNESASGSVVGATGAIYALRKELYRPLPPSALIDDVLTPLNVVKQAKRVVFDSSAVAFDVVSNDAAQEWRRKVRTLAGNWQLINLCPGLFRPSVNPLCWRFIGHKFLRLLVPFALIILFVTSFTQNYWLARVLGWLQVVGYCLVIAAHFNQSVRKFGLINTAYFFTVLNLAALVGFGRWIRNTHETSWHNTTDKKTKKGGVPVLMYHALEDDEHPAGYTEPGDKVYVLQVEQFREQMAYLKENSFKTYLIDELLEMDCLPEKAVVLTFDDGHESNATLALPILKEYGFKAHFFITTGWIGTPHFLTAEQVRALHDSGMGIGSHGVTHSFISDLDETSILFELSESKHVLEQIVGKKVSVFSAPGGRYCRQSIQDVQGAGYRHFVSSEVGLLSVDDLNAVIPRCTMKAATTQVEFVAVITGDTAVFDKLLRRARVLVVMKKVLGNRLYEKMRKIVV